MCLIAGRVDHATTDLFAIAILVFEIELLLFVVMMVEPVLLSVLVVDLLHDLSVDIVAAYGTFDDTVNVRNGLLGPAKLVGRNIAVQIAIMEK